MASGQVVNTENSALLFSPNVNMDFRSTLSMILAIPMVDNLGKYLGVPSSFSWKQSDDFRAIKQKVCQTLHGSKENFFLPWRKGSSH